MAKRQNSLGECSCGPKTVKGNGKLHQLNPTNWEHSYSTTLRIDQSIPGIRWTNVDAEDEGRFGGLAVAATLKYAKRLVKVGRVT